MARDGGCAAVRDDAARGVVAAASVIEVVAACSAVVAAMRVGLAVPRVGDPVLGVNAALHLGAVMAAAQESNGSAGEQRSGDLGGAAHAVGPMLNASTRSAAG